MKRKKILSTHDYVHINKNTITLGRKGTTKTTIKKTDIINAFTTIQAESIRLSKQGTRNSKIPSDLGLNGKITSIVSQEFNVFNDLLQEKNNNIYSSKLIIARYNRLMRLSKPRNFANEFYKDIRRYYGVTSDISEKTLRQVYRKGGLKAPQADIGRLPIKPPNYYARMQRWVDNNIAGAKTHYVVADVDEFNAVAQTWELSLRRATIMELKALINKEHWVK